MPRRYLPACTVYIRHVETFTYSWRPEDPIDDYRVSVILHDPDMKRQIRNGEQVFRHANDATPRASVVDDIAEQVAKTAIAERLDSWLRAHPGRDCPLARARLDAPISRKPVPYPSTV